jgi:hypothetical protein
MTIATALRASLLCVCVGAAAKKDASTVFACNLKAISAAERPRYNKLVKRVREAVRDRTEMSNGYAFKLDSKTITLPEAAEWISMERLCCPFLTLQLSAAGNQAHWVLTLTGPEGVKPLIEAEFPTH